MTNMSENKFDTAMLKLIGKTASKTLIYILCGIIMFLSMLSFVHSGSAKAFYNLGLYSNAASASARDFRRKARNLERQTDESYQEYRTGEYFDSLLRAVEYNQAFYRESNKPRAGKKFLELADIIVDEQRTGFNRVDSESVKRVPYPLKMFVYNKSAAIKYQMLDAALRLNDSPRIAAYIERFFVNENLRAIFNFETTNSFDIVPRTLPHWAAGALVDNPLRAISYKFPTNILTAFSPGALESYPPFDMAAFENGIFWRFIQGSHGSYGYTTMFLEMIETAERIATVLNYVDYDYLSDPEKLQYLWYESVIRDAYYSISSVLEIMYIMNTGAFAAYYKFPVTQIAELTANDRMTYNIKYDNYRRSFNAHYDEFKS